MVGLVVAKIISLVEQVIDVNDRLRECYSDFLDVLNLEEESIIDHNIAEYEIVAGKKEMLASEIMNLYQALSKHCESICEMIPQSDNGSLVVKKLSDMNNVFDMVLDNASISDFQREILFNEITKVKTSISDVLSFQRDAKEFVERNVMLISKLINNHRQSYQFWRETIATESVGYNDRGVRKTGSQSVSMFNAKA